MGLGLRGIKGTTCDVIILAAGEGTRMKSPNAKILHKVGGRSIIEHVLHNSQALQPQNCVIVTDEKSNFEVLELANKYHNSPVIVNQLVKRGTGDAVKIAMKSLVESSSDCVVILYGDVPLVRSETIEQMLALLAGEGKDAVLLAFETVDDQYGEITIDSNSDVIDVVEAKERSPQGYNRKFLANAGAMVLNRDVASLVEKISSNNHAGEYYLTDIVRLARHQSFRVGYVTTNEEEVTGVNDRTDLAKVEMFFQEAMRKQFLAAGVTLISPKDVFFSFDSQISPDVTVHPYVVFDEGVKVASGSEILSYTHLAHCSIKQNCVVGPFARIRGGTILNQGVNVGNFVEVKESTLGVGVKVKHLSYVGNSSVGANTNIGAGTVVCNYDGKNKLYAEIGESCFIGANTTIISPIKIGDGAILAAGSTVSADVPPDSLAIARKRQKVIVGYRSKKG